MRDPYNFALFTSYALRCCLHYYVVVTIILLYRWVNSFNVCTCNSYYIVFQTILLYNPNKTYLFRDQDDSLYNAVEVIRLNNGHFCLISDFYENIGRPRGARNWCSWMEYSMIRRSLMEAVSPSGDAAGKVNGCSNWNWLQCQSESSSCVANPCLFYFITLKNTF